MSFTNIAASGISVGNFRLMTPLGQSSQKLTPEDIARMLDSQKTTDTKNAEKISVRDTTPAANSLIASAGAQTRIDAQMIGQQMNSETSQGTHKFKEFMESTRENPGGFWRAQVLASKGLTEEDVAAMTPEDRQKLEQEILEEIKKKAEEARLKAETEKL